MQNARHSDCEKYKSNKMKNVQEDNIKVSGIHKNKMWRSRRNVKLVDQCAPEWW